MSWWKTRVDVFLLRFGFLERGEDEIGAKNLSSLPSKVSAVEIYFAGGSVEPLTLIQNKNRIEMLRDFLDHNPKRQCRSYVYRTNMSIARLDA